MNVRRIICAFAALAAVAAVACGGSAPDPRYPAEDAGCPIASYPGAPDVGVDNLGAVSAWCDDGTDETACYRQLKDEACRLGADVIWGVPDHPVDVNGKHQLKARAAHTKAGKAGPSAQ